MTRPVSPRPGGGRRAADRPVDRPSDVADLPYQPDESPFGALMHLVCVELGFCGCIKNGQPLHVDLIVPPRGPVTADQFVEWVFLADNMNPSLHPERWQEIKAAIRAAFVEHMGGEVVDARRLRWSVMPAEDAPDRKFRGPL